MKLWDKIWAFIGLQDINDSEQFEVAEDNRNFFERMESEIDFDKEYYKIEDLMTKGGRYEYQYSIEYQIREYFLRWDKRDTYTSFEELRDSLGFPLIWTEDGYKPTASGLKLNDYLVYCEMVINLIGFLKRVCRKPNDEDGAEAVIETIGRNLSKLGMRFHVDDNARAIIVQNSPEANRVAEILKKNISNAVIEYNHHLLKGNIEKKQTLLKVLADDLESRRKELKNAGFTRESDLFFLFNKMSIRHNNVDPTSGAYQEEVAKLSKKELEYWYDETYQLALYAYLFLDNIERGKRINALKQTIGG